MKKLKLGKIQKIPNGLKKIFIIKIYFLYFLDNIKFKLFYQPPASSSVKSNYGEVVKQFKNLTEIIAT